MYLDGTGLDDLGTQDCKSLSHGHQTYGEWSWDLLQWATALKAEAEKTRPGSVFIGEGMGDVYHTVLDTGLFYPENAPEVYRYTLPWNTGLIMPGTSPIPGWPDGGLEYGAVYGLKIAGLDHNFERDPARFPRLSRLPRALSPVPEPGSVPRPGRPVRLRPEGRGEALRPQRRGLTAARCSASTTRRRRRRRA